MEGLKEEEFQNGRRGQKDGKMECGLGDELNDYGGLEEAWGRLWHLASFLLLSRQLVLFTRHRFLIYSLPSFLEDPQQKNSIFLAQLRVHPHCK